METLNFGDVTVERLVELEAPGYHPGFFLPESTPRHTILIDTCNGERCKFEY